MTNDTVLCGTLLGIALGDAAGLATEGLSRRRITCLHRGPIGPSLLFGRLGLMSDDGEHACMTAQALIVSGGTPHRFASSLAWRLRLWILGLPAGVGSATARAIVRLWLGFPPDRSGVFSAGNGPAMRAPVIGAAFANDFAAMKALVTISTRLTHSDPKANQGALAVALATALAVKPESEGRGAFVERLSSLLAGEDASEFIALIEGAAESARRNEAAEQFAERLGLGDGVSGYMFHTVPVVLQIWLRRPGSFEEAIGEVIRLGGDTDTTAAILGGILGAEMGPEGLPISWLHRIVDWPRSAAWISKLARRLARVCETGRPTTAQPLAWPALPLRNLVFLIAVLAHGLRRALPPW